MRNMIFDADIKTGIPISPLFSGKMRLDSRGISFSGAKNSAHDFFFEWGTIQIDVRGDNIRLMQINGSHLNLMAHHSPAHMVGQLGNFIDTNRRVPNDDEYDRMKAVSQNIKGKGCLVFILALPLSGVLTWLVPKIFT